MSAAQIAKRTQPGKAYAKKTSHQSAAKRSKKALYICPGAGHVRSISTDREKYYAVVNEFLDKYGF